jgi:hypothetical protein
MMAHRDADSPAIQASWLRHHRRMPGQQGLSPDHQRRLTIQVHVLRIRKRMRMTRLTLVVR